MVFVGCAETREDLMGEEGERERRRENIAVVNSFGCVALQNEGLGLFDAYLY